MIVLSAEKFRRLLCFCLDYRGKVRSAPCLFLFFFSLFILIPRLPPVRAQSQSPLPVISRLDSRDLAFRQYLSDVEIARRSLFARNPTDQAALEGLVSSLAIYSYIPGEGEDLLSIAARCLIPYSTLASLNRLPHIEDMAPGKPLLLSTIPGIFIPETPNSSLESLLFSGRAEDGGWLSLSIPRDGSTERFRFIPGDDFTATERIYFLNRGFQFPLRNFRVSSPYGPRINPVTGLPGIHRGLDLAAPEGTEVYAAKSGTVVDIGEDPVMGKYVIVRHDDNWVSFYGHLSSIDTALNARVQSASLIARVGSTGQSTGPHLHFELRQNGQDRDPARLLGIFRGN